MVGRLGAAVSALLAGRVRRIRGGRFRWLLGRLSLAHAALGLAVGEDLAEVALSASAGMTESAISSRTSRTPRWLVNAAQRGDPAAERELLRRYEPLVQRVVWKLRLPPGCEREDLAQEARVGPFAAIRAWRPERGPFPALADRCVSNQALLALEADCRHKHQLLSQTASLDASITHDSNFRSPVTLLDVLPAPCDARTDPEARLLIREQLSSVLRALPTLTASEHTALAGTLSGRSYQQMAPAPFGTWRAAEHAAYRARRKLAAALPRAA
ncbi:MAG: sigma factor [Solirubrobacteraceae bacterium]